MEKKKLYAILPSDTKEGLVPLIRNGREIEYAFCGVGTFYEKVDIFQCIPLEDIPDKNPFTGTYSFGKSHIIRIGNACNPSVINNLMEKGAILSYRVIKGLVYMAACENNIGCLKYLAKKRINLLEYDINRLLIIATDNEYLEMMKYLIENGANIHEDRDYALRCMAHRNNFTMIKYLVEHGANINVYDGTVIRSLSSKFDIITEKIKSVSEREQLNMIKYLVEHGANVDFCQEDIYLQKYPIRISEYLKKLL
jgi:hypothetical protein